MIKGISSGGVVFNKGKVLLIYWSSHDKWELPKGTVKSNESLEQACVREILEETGYKVKIVDKINDFTIIFDWEDGSAHKKIVHNYLMILTNDEKQESKHNLNEDFKIFWVDIDEAINKASYNTFKETLRLAKGKIDDFLTILNQNKESKKRKFMSIESRFIISGGYVSSAPDGGKRYCEEVLEGVERKPIQILESLFAQVRENWEAAFEKDKNLFSKIFPDVPLQLSLADRVSFISQLDHSDVLIIHGGSTELLLEFLGQKDNLRRHIKGKTIVGHSAGAYALSRYYLQIGDEGRMKLKEGLGYLPIKTVAHYGSDYYRLKYPEVFSWDKVDLFMQQNKPELEYIKLKEGEFRVFLKKVV